MTEQQIEASNASNTAVANEPAPTAEETKKNPLLRHADFSFPSTEIDRKVDSALQRQQGSIALPGFRRGKVPLSMLRQRYGKATLHEILQQECAPKFQDEMQQTGERAAAAPQLQLPDVAAEGIYKVHCHYEIIPPIAAPDFTDKTLSKPTFEVNDAAVDGMVEILRKQRGAYKTVDGGASGEDVRLKVDFESVLLPAAGDADGEEEKMESGEDRPLLLDDKTLRPELRDALTGAVAGDSRSVEIELGDDTPNENLRGRKMRMSVNVKSVERLEKAELDEKFFALFGEDATLEAFRGTVREHLQRESKTRLRNFLHTRAMQLLTEATPPFPLPQTMLYGECQRLLQQAQAQWKQRGMGETAATLNLQMFAPDAYRRVALGLILSAWQQREKPQIEKEAIDARVEEIAAAYEDPAAAAAQLRGNKNEMEAIYLSVLEDRVTDWVCENCKTEDAPMSLEDFFSDAGAG